MSADPSDPTEIENPPAPADAVPSELEVARERKESETLGNGFLTPRHRRLAQLAASGVANKDICKELGYTASRMSILIREPTIQAEIYRLQDRIFEGTIVDRMKGFTDASLNVIENALTDVTGHVKMNEKLDIAKWIIEMQHGKATQKIEGGEGMLAALMDRLDARQTQAPVVNLQVNNYGSETKDVTPNPLPTQATDAPQLEQSPPDEEGLLTMWVDDFTRQK